MEKWTRFIMVLVYILAIFHIVNSIIQFYYVGRIWFYGAIIFYFLSIFIVIFVIKKKSKKLFHSKKANFYASIGALSFFLFLTFQSINRYLIKNRVETTTWWYICLFDVLPIIFLTNYLFFIVYSSDIRKKELAEGEKC